MKKKPSKFLESHRVTEGCYASPKSFGNNGAFLIPHGDDVLQVFVSDQNGWDHCSVSVQRKCSVSLPKRCPTWEEMCYVKELFFRADEWVVQYHPPPDKNINNHEFCLHLWRPRMAVQFPTPPREMV